MTEAIFRYRTARVGERGLFPVDTESDDVLRKLKLDRDVSCEVIQRRNPRHHRLFFGMVNFVKMHCSVFENATTDQIKDALKLATGLADTFIDAQTGKRYFVLKSISFAAMDQTRFNEFFSMACNVIAQRWMPQGVTPDDVRNELFLMIDGPHAAQVKTA